jgi:hypothetical protein
MRDEDPGVAEVASPHDWLRRIGALLYVFFCFELGVFLLMFPWTDYWPRSYFSGLGPAWDGIWNNPYLRGAISGLGVIDIGISFSEVFRLRRFAGGRGRRSLQ